jgi:hypothetical protein
LKIEYHDGEVVELEFDDRLHSYRIEPNHELIPSVTQNMDVISKPGLIPWALKEGVEWLSKNLFYDTEKDNYHTKSVGIDFLTKGIKGAYRNTSTSAINIGTVTHQWVEGAIRWKLEGGDPPPILRCDKKTGKFECVQSENFELDFDAFLAAQRLRRRLKVLSKKRK